MRYVPPLSVPARPRCWYRHVDRPPLVGAKVKTGDLSRAVRRAKADRRDTSTVDLRYHANNPGSEAILVGVGAIGSASQKSNLPVGPRIVKDSYAESTGSPSAHADCSVGVVPDSRFSARPPNHNAGRCHGSMKYESVLSTGRWWCSTSGSSCHCSNSSRTGRVRPATASATVVRVVHNDD